MFQNNLVAIASQFSDYATHLFDDKNSLEIRNPFGNENIKLEYVPEDEWTPYILYFSFQHWHMNDEEDIIEHIYDIINGKLLSIEFFKCGRRCFGGDIEAKELQDLSYETLENFFSDFPFGKLKDIADSFKVRGCKPDANFDAVFDVDACGKTTIKINNT